MEIKTAKGGTIEILLGTGVSSEKSYESLLPVIRAAISSGIRGFDTAPSYGTEGALGRCLLQCAAESGLHREDLFIQTKVDAWQMAEGPERIKWHAADAIKKMGVDYIDSFLIHWPVPEYMERTWSCLTGLKGSGIVRHVGICNLRMRQLDGLSEPMPQIVQLERNPLRTCRREIGFCHAHDISVQAYSPLCKMHDDIADSRELKAIADKHKKSIGQVVLRWHLDTGATPIFTSKKESRIKEYMEIFDFKLSAGEIETVNKLNRDYKMYLESRACPGF